MMDKELLMDMQKSNTVPTLKETISDLKKVISRKLQSCNNTIQEGQSMSECDRLKYTSTSYNSDETLGPITSLIDSGINTLTGMAIGLSRAQFQIQSNMMQTQAALDEAQTLSNNNIEKAQIQQQTALTKTSIQNQEKLQQMYDNSSAYNNSDYENYTNNYSSNYSVSRKEIL